MPVDIDSQLVLQHQLGRDFRGQMDRLRKRQQRFDLKFIVFHVGLHFEIGLEIEKSADQVPVLVEPHVQRRQAFGLCS